MATFKITEQGKKLYIRRWNYCNEKKRSVPTTVHITSKFLPDVDLPESVIKEFDVTAEEQELYAEFIKNHTKEKKKQNSKVSLSLLKGSLESTKTALTDPELRDTLTLDEYVELSETIGEIKKLITKNKNYLNRKQAKKEK